MNTLSNARNQETPRVGPLQSIKAAVHDVNCTLDFVRARFVSLFPDQRSLPGFSIVGKRPHRGALRRPVNFRGSQFAAAIPGDTVVEQVFTSGISSFLNLYNTVLIGRIILTWFPSAPPQIVNPLATITDPYLNLFRGIIPPLGGTLDLSPILAFVVLDLFTNAAGALPCELGQEQEAQHRERRFQLLSPSQAAMAFRRRRAAERRRQQERCQQK